MSDVTRNDEYESDEDEDQPWDFRTQADRDKLRHLLDERDPKRRQGIFASIEWDAVATDLLDTIEAPVSMRLHCPSCAALHIDEGEFATKLHHTHACQECGLVWRPAIVPTVGVRFLPGFAKKPCDECDGSGFIVGPWGESGEPARCQGPAHSDDSGRA